MLITGEITHLFGLDYYIVTTEVVNSAIKEMAFSEEQVTRITNHVLSKMLIGSIIAVSIASVVIASFLAPMIFQ